MANPEQAVASASQAASLEPKSRLAHWLAAQSVLTLAGDVPKIRKRTATCWLRPVFASTRHLRVICPPRCYICRTIPAGSLQPVVDLSVSRIFIFNANAQTAFPSSWISSTHAGLSGADKQKEATVEPPSACIACQRNPKPSGDGFLGKLAITWTTPTPRTNGRAGLAAASGFTAYQTTCMSAHQRPRWLPGHLQ